MSLMYFAYASDSFARSNIMRNENDQFLFKVGLKISEAINKGEYSIVLESVPNHSSILYFTKMNYKVKKVNGEFILTWDLNSIDYTENEVVTVSNDEEEINMIVSILRGLLAKDETKGFIYDSYLGSFFKRNYPGINYKKSRNEAITKGLISSYGIEGPTGISAMALTLNACKF